MTKKAKPSKGGPRKGAIRANTTPRGQAFDVLTVDGLLDWHQQNVRTLQTDWKGDVVQAACWFAAYQEALQQVEDNTLKDWATMLTCGWPPLNSTPALADWLEQWVEGCENYEGRTTRAFKERTMLDLLTKFWLTGSDGSPSIEESEHGEEG